MITSWNTKTENMTKLIFDYSAWENSDYIVTVRPDWEKEWKSAPIGHVLDKDTARRIAEWLNTGGYREIEIIFSSRKSYS